MAGPTPDEGALAGGAATEGCKRAWAPADNCEPVASWAVAPSDGTAAVTVMVDDTGCAVGLGAPVTVTVDKSTGICTLAGPGAAEDGNGGAGDDVGGISATAVGAGGPVEPGPPAEAGCAGGSRGSALDSEEP